MSDYSDRELGMHRRISRRDFLNGMAVGAGVIGAGGALSAQEQARRPGPYPPTLAGMRGSHDGSFEAAHALRDGTFEDPILLHLVRTPCKPGLPAREQHKAGRADLVATTFETFERKIRDQLARTLGGGGFDPARDIQAITVNRWPHGYGYEYNPLFDPEWPPGDAPHEIGRQRFGRITIANSDSGATAYTDVAIDQAYRAVSELFGS